MRVAELTITWWINKKSLAKFLYIMANWTIWGTYIYVPLSSTYILVKYELESQYLYTTWKRRNWNLFLYIYRKYLHFDLHTNVIIMTSFLRSRYLSIVLTKEHCTEIVKLNYVNQSATMFFRTMNEILPELKGVYRKTNYGISRGYTTWAVLDGRYWDKGSSQSVWFVKTFHIEICHWQNTTETSKARRLKFFKSRSNFKVKVTSAKILVPMERSCHKECTYVIWKPYIFWLGSYGQG